MVKRLFEKIKTMFLSKAESDFTAMTVIALIVFLVSLGLNYVLNYVNSPAAQRDVLYNWEYLYSNHVQLDSEDHWHTATVLNPISQEKTGDYLHLITTVKASDVPRTLVIRTDHAPVKVTINQREVYNNWYGQTDYVGNNYNAITIPPSVTDPTIRISLRLPYAATLQISMGQGPAEAVRQVGAWSWLALGVTGLGLVLLVVNFALLFTRRRNALGFMLALGIITYGLAASLSLAANATYLLNGPEMYGISIAVLYLSQTIAMISVLMSFKLGVKRYIAPFLLGLLAAAAGIAARSVSANLITMVAQYAMLFIVSLLMIGPAKALLKVRIRFSKALSAIVVYFGICCVASVLVHTVPEFRQTLAAIPFIYVPVVLGFVLCCYVAHLLSDREIEKTELRLDVYDRSIDMIPQLIKRITCESDANAIYMAVAGCVRDICVTVLGDQTERNMGVCIGLKTEAGYEVLYEQGIAERPNFQIIEKHYLETEELCIFSQTYFSMIYRDKTRINAIIYFEGFDEILSTFFVKAIETVHSVTDVLMLDLQGSSDVAKDEQEIFIKLAKDVESNTGGNETHVDRVSRYTYLILEKMNYPQEVCQLVASAATLHDIGKIAIPAEITNNYGLLSDKERAIMNKHTEYGRRLLGSFDSEFMRTAAVIAAEHHEQFDGEGYYKKMGKQIDKFARVVSVADVFDALTTRRSYKESWSFTEAINYIHQGAGKKYDPEVVAALEAVIAEIEEDTGE